MGLFDTVFISDDILTVHNICCPKCGTLAGNSFQTKDFQCGLDTYFLEYDPEEYIRLYKSDHPSDKEKYWKTHTEEEKENIKKKIDDPKNFIFKWSLKEKLDEGGEWKEEAWKPENRHKRHMGCLPHQICNFYTGCKSCDWKDSWISLIIKFTDGIAVSVKKEE